MRALDILSLVVTLLAVPTVLVVQIWRSDEPSGYGWLTAVLHSGVGLVLLALIGPWYWLILYLPYLWLSLYAIGALVSYRRVRHKPFLRGEGLRRWFGKPIRLLELGLFVVGLVIAVGGWFPPAGGVRLTFPLRDGRYSIAQGGDSVLVNGHYTNEAQRYAVDVVALSRYGTRAQGVYPEKLSRYHVYGRAVHSPCSGTVIASVNGMPDHVPPETDRERPAGNHVAIACRDVTVILAHFQEGSVDVAEGAEVTIGQVVGRVGNSGNTTEPHLHIHAVAGTVDDALSGTGIPMRFDGSFPVRNRVYLR